MSSLTPEEIDGLLQRFHGFHDAEYLGIELIPSERHNGTFSCRISLLARDYSAESAVRVVVGIDGVGEFQIRYNDQFDYPNVRDDITINMFDNRIYLDLGGAATDPQSANDVRQSDIYFVGRTLWFDEDIQSC